MIAVLPDAHRSRLSNLRKFDWICGGAVDQRPGSVTRRNGRIHLVWCVSLKHGAHPTLTPPIDPVKLSDFPLLRPSNATLPPVLRS